MKTRLLLFLINISLFNLYSQRFTIQGTLEDANSGEKLLYATIYDAYSFKGTTSNYYGFYSLTLPKGQVKLVISYLGYQADTIELFLQKDTTINRSIDQLTQIEEVVISGNQGNKVQSTQMGQMTIPIMQSKQLPVLLGETDILKTIQLLPGVKGGTEGTSGIYVRGGGPDQNLILLDGVPVYNVNHLFGFMSVFNSNAIQSFSLLKGGFPARYGGRLSSVLDIKMKEGNNKEFHGEGNVGLVSASLTVEGPIIKEKTSFIVSFRRTYFDFLTAPLVYFASEGEAYGGYFFHDLNVKVNHRIDDRNHIFYSFYYGLDKFYARSVNSITDDEDFKLKTGIGWGNTLNAIRWNRIVSDQIFANFTGTYSNYNFFSRIELEDEAAGEDYKIEYLSGIKDWGFKTDIDYVPSSIHYIRSGWHFTYHTYIPGVNTFEAELGVSTPDIDETFGNKSLYGYENNFFVEDDIQLTDRLKANIGGHFSMFRMKGKTYTSLQPRFSVRYLINQRFSAKSSYVEMNQYIHLLTSSSITLPSDLWVPATNRVKPQFSRMFASGIEYKLTDLLNLSIEAYYKTMDNLIEYKEGASFYSINDDWQDKIIQGKGDSKGLEVLLQKETGKWTGWIGYTLSKTNRRFQDINQGKEFPYKYDRRHDIALALVYNYSERFDAGITWVYGTGLATTLAEDQYIPVSPFLNVFHHADPIESFKHRNSYRMPDYHRMDVAFNLHKQKKYFKRTISFGAYNAYNRQNPFFLQFETNYKSKKSKLYQYSIFQIMPFWSYKIVF